MYKISTSFKGNIMSITGDFILSQTLYNYFNPINHLDGKHFIVFQKYK